LTKITAAGPLDGVSFGELDAANAAITAQATAALTAGQPSEWLISYHTSEQQIADQAQVISAASALPAAQADTAARLQHFRALKARVLQGAAGAASTANAGTASEPLPSVQVLEDFSHLPITFVSIRNAEELARLRAHPNVLNVEPNKVAYPATLSEALQHIGQPAVQAQGYVGGGTVVILDTGELSCQRLGPAVVP
jgi:hypothetical protein